jgi:hypothetical protein
MVSHHPTREGNINIAFRVVTSVHRQARNFKNVICIALQEGAVNMKLDVGSDFGGSESSESDESGVGEDEAPTEMGQDNPVRLHFT